MAQMKPLFVLLFGLSSLLLPAAIQPSVAFSFPFSQYEIAVSLSHSLLTRVSDLRAARGDVSGSHRAKLIAQQLKRGSRLGIWGIAWSAGWDYLKDYSWRELDYREAFSAVSELNELMRHLGELTRAESATERAAWISRIGQMFQQSGALRKVLLKTVDMEVVKAVKMEVVEGALLRDCLEVGSDDLKGLVEILKDLSNKKNKILSRM